MKPYDNDGQLLTVGDYVRRVDSRYLHYVGWAQGESRRILDVDGDKIILNNPRSPYGTSYYHAENFVISNKRRAKQEAPMAAMLHIAVRVDNNDYDYIAATINAINGPVPSDLRVSMMADISQDGIKEKVRQRVVAYPTERWLILSGNTIGETASPPVRFRSA